MWSYSFIKFEDIVKSKKRFLLPILICLFAKFVGVLFVFYTSPLMEFYKDYFHLLFFNWDSGWFVSIADKWYPTKLLCLTIHEGRWAFFPAYPFLIKIVDYIVKDLRLSAVLIALVFGFLWLPFFQAVCENYMERREALNCTLLMSFFPTVFLFTTVAYSEALFLFLCVAAWYWYKKGKLLFASLAVGFASITKIYGIFLVIPMFIDILQKQKWITLQYALIPPTIFSTWFLYAYLKTGDWLIWLHVERKIWNAGGVSWFNLWLRPTIFGDSIIWNNYSTSLIIMIALFAYLFFRVYEVDPKLSLFSSVTFLLIIFFGDIHSYTRFLPLIFPIWLTVRIKRIDIVIAICIFFYVSGLILWSQFLQGGGWIA